jgi:uncharacterized Zn finger protein
MKNHTYETTCNRCGSITQRIYAEVSAKGFSAIVSDMAERYCRACEQEPAQGVAFIDKKEIRPRRFSIMVD